MKAEKRKFLALLLSLIVATSLALTGCNGNNNNNDSSDDSSNVVDEVVSQLLDGDVTGQVGNEYQTTWFKFTVNSMETASSFEGYDASSGNTLLIANVTITNTFGSTQPFGTFDWFVDDGSMNAPIFPIDPLDGVASMMQDSYDLQDGQTVTYDVVVEYPSNQTNLYFMYIEIDAQQNIGTTFKIAIK
jgi:hypothetical protein